MAAHYTNWLNVSSPKGRDVLCRIWQEFGRTESPLSAETLQINLLYQLKEEIRVGVDLIQKKIILCSVTLFFFFFLEALTCLCTTDCLGSEIFCLELEFSSPGVYIHTSHPVLLCCGNPSRTEQCPYACRDTALHPWKGNCSLASFGSCMQLSGFSWQSPSPFLTFAQGWYNQPDPDSSGQDLCWLGRC